MFNNDAEFKLTYSYTYPDGSVRRTVVLKHKGRRFISIDDEDGDGCLIIDSKAQAEALIRCLQIAISLGEDK